MSSAILVNTVLARTQSASTSYIEGSQSISNGASLSVILIVCDPMYNPSSPLVSSYTHQSITVNLLKILKHALLPPDPFSIKNVSTSSVYPMKSQGPAVQVGASYVISSVHDICPVGLVGKFLGNLIPLGSNASSWFSIVILWLHELVGEDPSIL